jgi:hypothetical protein
VLQGDAQVDQPDVAEHSQPLLPRASHPTSPGRRARC